MRIEESRPRLNQMAREIYGIEMNPGPFGMDSLPALIAVKVAESLGQGERFHARVMRAYWEEAQGIEERSDLVRLAAEVGMAPAEFEARLSEPAYAQQVAEEMQQAALYGLTGVPAMIIAEKYLVSGAQPPDALRQIADRVQALQAEADQNS